MKKINVGVIGGAGYTGGELLRILVHHPYVTISFVHSRSSAGKPVTAIHSDLLGDTDLLFSDVLDDSVDLLVLCVGHGEARQFLDTNVINPRVKLIDLSQDFRLSHTATHGERAFVYGLPELQKAAISQAANVSNPGCFATAIQLGLLPLAQAHLLSDVYTTGITGSTGAGQGLSATSHFSWRANNIQAYKSLSHQHMAEISQSLATLQPGFANDGDNRGLNFVPWRGDFTRGIFVSSQLRCAASLEQLFDLYENFYREHPFTIVSKEPVSLKQVVNSNKCVIHLEKNGQQLVVHSAIDNLLKGASGQAVQNMNLMFGLKEDAGLQLKAIGF